MFLGLSVLAVASVTILGALGAPALAGTAAVSLSVSGVAVPENGQVPVGATVGVKVSGFAPGATVSLQFGDKALSTSVVTDARGVGTASYRVPTVPTNAYLVTATSDQTVATFVVVVNNPATRTPASTRPTKSASTSSSKSPTELSKTGSLSPPVSASGAVLIALGLLLVRAAAPQLYGRHERFAGGAHSRMT